MPVCDVCSEFTEFKDGYALTTREIVLNPEYWLFQIQQHDLEEDVLSHLIEPRACQRSGWLVCESCSLLFEFDRAKARACAERQIDPPGSGSVPALAAAESAARAWHRLHGRQPRWLRAG
jgi:hypothetical protein